MTLGPIEDDVAAAIREAAALLPRIRQRDHTVWQDDPAEVADRLGWLDAPDRGEAVADELLRVAADVVADGVTDVLLVGMGGSSLYPEVLATLFGPRPGRPRLRVLDSTDPAAVLATERALPWQATLVVPASKSGTTTETMAHLARFGARLRDVHGRSAGRFVVPVTDPGSPLDARSADEGFRTVVRGQPDVGGRFSALTPFGLFPAALLGLDPTDHLAPARDVLDRAFEAPSDRDAPVALGAAMGAAARAGRDKLTVLLPDELASFGAWVEQLVAESTGKHGVGVLPVLDEPADATRFGPDRLVVAVGEQPGIEACIDAGHPVVALPWRGTDGLAAEVVRWELATAIAGALLGINPFDQPDVAAAKDATRRVLEAGQDLPPPGDAADVLGRLEPGGYVALLAFVTPGGDDERRVRDAATRLRTRTSAPVTVGIGPRYLHSTGQLHKGGPPGGVFLVVVGDDREDAEVPGEPYTFSTLKRAQAAGDLAALRDAGRPATLVTLAGLDAMTDGPA